ncbi:CAP domain-containing protein [Pyronema omphalodes]|nr:CAP domain-containing protein [Pyronema omphalodes]KAI5813964.1 CAP domain-containing protein [Pyronema omphalodes]
MPSDPRFAAEFVAAHNKYRDQHGVPRLTWSPALAQQAQAHANRCQINHEEAKRIGENIAKGTPNRITGPAQVVDYFADERNWYDYNAATSRLPGRDIGHFTQVVWEETREVGCGFRHDCPDAQTHMYTCRYNPPGNVQLAELYRKNVHPPRY